MNLRLYENSCRRNKSIFRYAYLRRDEIRLNVYFRAESARQRNEHRWALIKFVFRVGFAIRRRRREKKINFDENLFKRLSTNNAHKFEWSLRRVKSIGEEQNFNRIIYLTRLKKRTTGRIRTPTLCENKK